MGMQIAPPLLCNPHIHEPRDDLVLIKLKRLTNSFIRSTYQISRELTKKGQEVGKEIKQELSLLLEKHAPQTDEECVWDWKINTCIYREISIATDEEIDTEIEKQKETRRVMEAEENPSTDFTSTPSSSSSATSASPLNHPLHHNGTPTHTTTAITDSTNNTNRSNRCTFHYVLGDYHPDRSCRLVSTVEDLQREWALRLAAFTEEVDSYKNTALNKLQKWKSEVEKSTGEKIQHVRKTINRRTLTSWEEEESEIQTGKEKEKVIFHNEQDRIKQDDSDHNPQQQQQNEGSQNYNNENNNTPLSTQSSFNFSSSPSYSPPPPPPPSSLDLTFNTSKESRKWRNKMHRWKEILKEEWHKRRKRIRTKRVDIQQNIQNHIQNNTKLGVLAQKLERIQVQVERSIWRIGKTVVDWGLQWEILVEEYVDVEEERDKERKQEREEEGEEEEEEGIGEGVGISGASVIDKAGK